MAVIGSISVDRPHTRMWCFRWSRRKLHGTNTMHYGTELVAALNPDQKGNSYLDPPGNNVNVADTTKIIIFSANII